MPAYVFDLVKMIAEMKGAKFASFDYTAKATGEKSRLVIILGADTRKLYERDIVRLQRMILAFETKGATLYLQAAQSILDSRLTSLERGVGNNPAYTCADTYIYPNTLSGISIHKESGEVYVCGLVEMKTVLVPGVFKKKNSAPLTIARERIERHLPSGRFRRYILRNVSRVSMNGETLIMETEPVVAI